MITLAEEKAIKQMNLSDQVFRTYHQLSDKCYGSKISCYYGQETLSKERNISARTIQRHIKTLKECGLIEVKRRGKKLTNIYTLKIKSIGLLLNSAYNKCKKSDTTNTSEKYNKALFDDVEEVVNYYIFKEGKSVVEDALLLIKTYKGTFNFKGFKLYLQKTIESVKKKLAAATKKASFIKYASKKNDHFNNYPQRDKNHKEIEDKFLNENIDIDYAALGEYIKGYNA